MRRLLCLKVLLMTSAIVSADDWNRYGGPSGDFRTPPFKTNGKGTEWKRALGVGTSGVVSDGKTLFTMHSEPDRENRSAREFTISLDRDTEKTLWEEAVAITRLPKQETFGAAPLQPQATPVVAEGRVFSLGCTGVLSARDAATGKLLWQTDLIVDSGASVVQYGFAASPILHEGRLIVPVGGKYATVAFEPANGKILWRSEAAEPAYATPVVMSLRGKDCLVQLTRDVVLGLEPSTGRTRWSYPLPKPKLTNVPTPIALSDNRLLLSGQGCDGTRMLVIELVEGEERVKELWVQRKAQFFYTNWATDGQAAYGFTGNGGKRLTALSLLDGKILSQDMGQTDAQVVCDGKQLLLVRSDGVVSLANTTADGIEADLKAQPLKDRCWAAPTIVDDTVILRTATEITRFPLAKLSKDFKPTVDSGVSALDAAYGQPSGKK